MLTALLAATPVWLFHRMLGWLGIGLDGFHEWLEGFCPCGAGSW